MLALLAASGLATSIWVSTYVHVVDPAWHDVVLFAHMASLVAGLGSVLAIDFLGLQWVLGRRSLQSVLTISAAASPLVWVGFAGLVATGSLLSPDLSSEMTRTKLVLVLLVALNGAFAGVMQDRLESAAAHPSRRLLAQGALTALVSQVAWWGATLVGFLNSQT